MTPTELRVEIFLVRDEAESQAHDLPYRADVVCRDTGATLHSTPASATPRTALRLAREWVDRRAS